jgi:hypothetical protein
VACNYAGAAPPTEMPSAYSVRSSVPAAAHRHVAATPRTRADALEVPRIVYVPESDIDDSDGEAESCSAFSDGEADEREALSMRMRMLER